MPAPGKALALVLSEKADLISLMFVMNHQGCCVENRLLAVKDRNRETH